MINKVRLWVRRYVRELILAISIALFVGILIPIGLEILGADIRAPVLWYSLWVLLSLFFIISIVAFFWYKIPCKRIQQSKNPDKWVSAKVKDVDSSQYLMYHELLQIDYVDFQVELRSELPFDIEFNFLEGVAIVNNNETHSALEYKGNIKLLKHSSSTIEIWRLNNWTDCIKNLLGQFEGGTIEIILKLSGEDNKHRHYTIATNAFRIEV